MADTLKLYDCVITSISGQIFMAISKNTYTTYIYKWIVGWLFFFGGNFEESVSNYCDMRDIEAKPSHLDDALTNYSKLTQ